MGEKTRDWVNGMQGLGGRIWIKICIVWWNEGGGSEIGEKKQEGLRNDFLAECRQMGGRAGVGEGGKISGTALRGVSEPVCPYAETHPIDFSEIPLKIPRRGGRLLGARFVD